MLLVLQKHSNKCYICKVHCALFRFSNRPLFFPDEYSLGRCGRSPLSGTKVGLEGGRISPWRPFGRKPRKVVLGDGSWHWTTRGELQAGTRQLIVEKYAAALVTLVGGSLLGYGHGGLRLRLRLRLRSAPSPCVSHGPFLSC